MQDRNVEFPNRFRMVKVEGTDDIYDVIPAPGEVLNPGTLLNKENLLTDETAAALGLTSDDPVVNDALKVLGVVRKKCEKIASYEVAGSYEWTAPDLADGKAYKIGVLIIGGGASGGATRNTTSSSPRFAAGGPSGFSTSIVLPVSPGDAFALVVGAGGARATWAAYNVSGNAGGSSSFNGVVADGGESPYDNNGDDAYARTGGSPSRCGYDAEDNGGFWGGAIILSYLSATSELCGRPDQCINPFTGERILGSGGGAYSTTSGTDSALAGAGGKNPLNGLGGGNGAAAIKGATITAEDASLPGCGGGAANVVGSGGVATSGAGADGAVYIYFLGVADE